MFFINYAKSIILNQSKLELSENLTIAPLLYFSNDLLYIWNNK